jgi:MFS family permease
MTMDEHKANDLTTGRRALVESVIASTIGTTIEWYDFFLYGTAVALVFPRLFFSKEDQFVAQVLSFGTFTVGFIARPVGGILFGHLGDRVGRKSTLVATLLLMGVSTILVGCLPAAAWLTPAAAAILLSVLRFVQGIGVGGEWGGSVLLALEHGHRGKRGFYASWPQAGVPLGLLASTSALGLFKWILPDEAFLAWGWRVPFLLSGLLIGVGLLIRLRILETPLFAQLKTTNRLAPAPVREVIRRHWREILLVAGSRVCEQSCFYLFAIYVVTYVEQVLDDHSGWILVAVPIAAVVEFLTIPLFGILSDAWSRKGTYAVGCLFMMALAGPYFALLETRNPLWIVTAVVVSLAVAHALLYSVQGSLIPELFGTRLRYSGASIGYQLANPFAGGLAPLVAIWLVKMFPGHYWPLAVYIALTAVLSLVCVLLLAETSRKDLSAAA